MSVNISALNFTLEDYQEAARTYRSELLHLAVIGLEEIKPYVTIRMGVRYAEAVGASSLKGVELAPYQKNRRAEAVLDIVLRELKTYFGSVNADFEPNEMISTLLGHHAAQAMGDGLKDTPTAKEVLALLVIEVSRRINEVIWSARRDPKGTTTFHLFDGWDTITDRDKKAGLISAEKKNYIKLTEKITDNNAVRIMNEIMRKMDKRLRAQDCFVYCSQDLVDAYNQAYLLTHSGIVYNTKYNQVSVEGSNGRLTFVPLSSKDGSTFIHIAPKSNMLVGVDQLSDLEKVEVGKYEPDVITMSMRMFFGVEFESVDPSRLLVVELPVTADVDIIPSENNDPDNFA